MSNVTTKVPGETTRSKVVIGLFKDPGLAERAYQTIVTRGYTQNDLSVVMGDETRGRHFGRRGGEVSERGSEGTSLLGSIVASIAPLAVPGQSLVIAGPLAATFQSASGFAGGFIGALVAAGLPEDRARAYESGVRGGAVAICARPRSEADAAWLESELRRHRGELVYR